MEEPLPLFDEPDDEAERQALDPGGFTGIYATDSRQSMEALLGEPDGVLVERVVENSPAAIAGIREGDLLLSATLEGREPVELRWPSQWRDIEVAARGGDRLAVWLDRAGREMEAELTVLDRVALPDREATVRYREEERVGVVLRTATEVEARAAGLGPGGGAVVVGLARESPWRGAGLRFGDLLVEIDGEAVEHPQVVLDRIRSAKRRERLAIAFVREGERGEVTARVSRRARQTREVRVPPLFRSERGRGRYEVSAIFGLFRYESTEAAWRFRLLYFIRFGGGSADRLKEVDG